VSSELHNTARVEWMGVTDHDANSLASVSTSAAEKTKLDEAQEFLRDELADRPMWAKQVLKDARDAGIAQATLYSAKTRLRVRSEKIGVKGWQWSLPTKEGTTPLSDEDVQNVQNVHSLQNLHREHSSNSPYLSEDPEGPEDPEGYEGRALEGDDNDGGGRLTPEQVDRVRRLRARGEVSSMAEARRLVLKEESVD
jgi:hypothetical protein